MSTLPISVTPFLQAFLVKRSHLECKKIWEFLDFNFHGFQSTKQEQTLQSGKD